MSSQDTNPADTARPITPPVVFYQNGELPHGMKDWRPQAVPANSPEVDETEEEVAPKAVSVPEPVSSYESPTTTEPDEPATPAQPPVAKASGTPKVTSPGSPPSSAPRKVVTKISD
jgi:hypothetical protein